MVNKKSILILTADAGFGHRSAANAIAAALELEHGAECVYKILNPIEDKRAPFFLRDSATDYDWLVRHSPELYRFGWSATDKELPYYFVEGVLTVALYEIMQDIIKEYNPDAIVSTYAAYQAPLISYFTINQYFVPLITVITDLISVHRLWFSPGVDLCLVPTIEVQKLAIANKIAKDKIHITGIPVSPKLKSRKISKRNLRMALDWDPALPTFLAVGSRRVGQLIESLNVLNHFGEPLQVVAVAGGDEALYEELKKIEWHVPSHIFKFVENMPDYMKAADAIICKAGGLIVTESLACGLPMLLIDVIPGQEEGNRDYVVQNGAGEMIESQMQMLETLSHWMANNGKVLREQALQARRLGKPNSAFDAVDLIWRAALRGPVNKRGRHGIGRLPLIDLLTRHNIPWREMQQDNID